MSLEWVVIADDLTGACDTGAAFIQPGKLVKVVLEDPSRDIEADILVYTTESRSLAEHEAYRAASEAARRLKFIPAFDQQTKIYKKIDSTLRGHPGPEFEAVWREAGKPKALVAPAFPEQGRTVRNGRVRVNGIRLEETPAGKEVTNPDLLNVFGFEESAGHIKLGDLQKESGFLLAWMQAHTGRIIVADAETVADLDLLALAFDQSGTRLACGSAGLARAVRRVKGADQAAQNTPMSNLPVFVISGSRHPVTKGQLAAARQAGVQIYEWVDGGLRSNDQEGFQAQDMINSIKAGNHTILAVGSQAYQKEKEKELVGRIAELAGLVIRGCEPGGLVLTGGDTAIAVCQQMKSKTIHLGGEVIPGIVWGRLEGGESEGLPVVFKSGGFGAANAILEAVHFLSPE